MVDKQITPIINMSIIPRIAPKITMRFNPRLMLIALTLAFASCQLGMDMFPPYLSRLEASIDLQDDLADEGITGFFNIERMGFVRSPTTGNDYLYLRIGTLSSGVHLFILDANTLKIMKSSTDPNIVNMIGISDSGDFISVSTTGTSYTLSSESTLTLMSTSPGLGLSVPPDAISVFNTTDSLILSYNSSGGGLSLARFHDLVIVPTPWTHNLFPTVIQNIYLRSAYCGGTDVNMLFTGYDSSGSYLINFPDIGSLASAGSPVASSATVVLPSADDNSGWVTKDGTILLNHEKGTTLIRYDNATGKEKDSFELGDSERSRYLFSPDGNKWIIYDEIAGKLHLLRTWW